MRYFIFNRQLPSMVLLCCVTTLTQAKIPVWTFIPLTPTMLTLNNTETATVQYQVHNQSIKPHQLAILSKTAALVQTAPCVLSPRGMPGDTCTLSLVVVGRELPATGLRGGPVLCQTDVNNRPNPNQCYLPSDGNELDITLVDNGPIVSSYTVTPGTTDGHLTISPDGPQTVSAGGRVQFVVTPDAGYSISRTVGGTCPAGTFSGNTYTITSVTSACTVNFSATSSVFAAATGPTNVNAVAGNSQATVRWTPPTNTGDGTISGYIVNYYLASTPATKIVASNCNPTTAQTCTVTGLTNGTTYGFTVQTVTSYNGSSETSSPSFSGFITPGVVTATPASLALKVSGNQRLITVTNNQLGPIQVGTLSAFTPALPQNTTINASNCINATLPAGGSCTITVTPGNTSSTAEANYNAPCARGFNFNKAIPSTATLSYVDGSVPISLQVLDKPCLYQSGFIFSINDNTPNTGSIGGKVIVTADQPNTTERLPFFPTGETDIVWGIDDSSRIQAPSPNASSMPPATFILGQLNCNATQDGACNTQNLVVAYGTGNNYPAGACKQYLDNTGQVCTSGVNCYQDWYLPAVCDMGPFGSTGTTGNYPAFANSLACINATDDTITTINNAITLLGNYWSSVESSTDGTQIWQENFGMSIGAQTSQSIISSTNATAEKVRCIRDLNY